MKINNKIHVAYVSFLALCIFFVVFTFQSDQDLPRKVIYKKETAYYMAQVVDYNLYPLYGDNRILFLDMDSHSLQTERKSENFYTDIVPAFSAFSDKLNKIHIIGAGAYTLPMSFKEKYPAAEVSVSEIDPEIESIAREYFGLDQDIQTEIGDARTKFNQSGTDNYDLIYGDAYNSFISVPWHLLTIESMQDIDNHLNSDGIYAINFIGALEGDRSKIFSDIYTTFNEVFPNNYVFAFGKDRQMVQNITIVGVKNENYIDNKILSAKLAKLSRTGFYKLILVDKKSLNNGNGIIKGLVFTDNFAPVEKDMRLIIGDYFKNDLPLFRQITH